MPITFKSKRTQGYELKIKTSFNPKLNFNQAF